MNDEGGALRSKKQGENEEENGGKGIVELFLSRMGDI